MPTYTAPTTRTTGELISAAIFNTDLVENIKYFKDAPAFAGNVTVGGTLGVTGLITSTGGITGGASSHTTGAFSSTVTGGTYNGQTISSAASLTGTLGVAGLLTVSGFGTHNFSAGGTGSNSLRLTNTTDGTGNYADFRVVGGTTSFTLSSFTQSFTTSGVNIQGSTLFDANGAGGMSLLARDASGAIRFYSGGTTLRTEIDASGNLRHNYGADNSTAVELWSATAGAGVLNCIIFYRNTSTAIGAISNDGSVMTYGGTSDARLKRDRGVSTDVSVLQRTVIHDFDWLETGQSGRGVFAQEAYAVNPRAIVVGSDERNSGGELVMPWMADYSKYVPDLIVGWQQHDAIISQLAARIAALESQDN